MRTRSARERRRASCSTARSSTSGRSSRSSRPTARGGSWRRGRVGIRGRSRLVAIYDFIPESGATRVELTTYSEPKTWVDRIRQRGAHRWIRRQSNKALKRLRRIFEEPTDGELSRVGIAGYDPAKAPRFGAHVPAGTDG